MSQSNRSLRVSVWGLAVREASDGIREGISLTAPVFGLRRYLDHRSLLARICFGLYCVNSVFFVVLMYFFVLLHVFSVVIDLLVLLSCVISFIYLVGMLLYLHICYVYLVYALPYLHIEIVL